MIFGAILIATALITGAIIIYTERAAKGYCRELGREGYVSDYMPVTLREVLS